MVPQIGRLRAGRGVAVLTATPADIATWSWFAAGAAWQSEYFVLLSYATELREYMSFAAHLCLKRKAFWK